MLRGKFEFVFEFFWINLSIRCNLSHRAFHHPHLILKFIWHNNSDHLLVDVLNQQLLVFAELQIFLNLFRHSYDVLRLLDRKQIFVIHQFSNNFFTHNCCLLGFSSCLIKLILKVTLNVVHYKKMQTSEVFPIKCCRFLNVAIRNTLLLDLNRIP